MRRAERARQPPQRCLFLGGDACRTEDAHAFAAVLIHEATELGRDIAKRLGAFDNAWRAAAVAGSRVADPEW